MTRLFVAAIAAFLVVLYAAPGMAAGPPLPGPKVAIHMQAHQGGKGVLFCDGAPENTLTGCGSFVTHGDLMTGYDLYIVIAQGDSTKGVAGVTFGMSYDDTPNSGIDFFGTPKFNMCANGLQYPSSTWPGSGSGTSITWNPETGCQRTKIPPYGVHATAGGFYIYAYSDDVFKITKHTKLENPVLSVADCSAFQTDLLDGVAAFAGFGTPNGCNSCLEDCSTPVEPSTWGKIKTAFSREQNK